MSEGDLVNCTEESICYAEKKKSDGRSCVEREDLRREGILELMYTWAMQARAEGLALAEPGHFICYTMNYDPVDKSNVSRGHLAESVAALSFAYDARLMVCP